MDSPRWDSKPPAGVADEREEAGRLGGDRGGGAVNREYSSMSSSRSRAARLVPKSSLDGAIARGCWRRDDKREDESGAGSNPRGRGNQNTKKGTEIVVVVDLQRRCLLLSSTTRSHP